MLKKLFSHTAIYGLAPQIPRIVSIFTLPIITKYLTEIDFGIYGVITAVAGGVAVLGNLGLNVILSNSFFKNPGQYKWGWRQIYGFLMLWNYPFAILLGILLYFFIPVEASENALYIILLNVLPVVFFGPTMVLGNMYYQLKQQPTQIAVRSIIAGILGIVLNVYFIAVLKLGYMGWFLSGCISTMLVQVSYWWPLNKKLGIKPIFNFKWRYIRNSLKIALPTVPHYYSSYLLDISDRAVMKIVGVNTGDIGKYNAAYTVANIVQKIGVAAGKAVSPMLYQTYKDNDEYSARKLIFILQIIFLCMTFILSIWLKEIFMFLIKNEELAQVYPLGIIIIMAYNYRPMYLGANNRLFYHEKTKVLLKVTFIAGFMNLLLNLALIKYFGYQVAAYTTFAALMYMGYAGYFLKDYKQTETLNYYPLLWLFLTILLTVISCYFVEVNYIFKIAITVLLLLLSVILLKRYR
ncbi:lipopolysaccharide biosynthesis protein [Albibacterium bauzanense]|uniref:O-antigen/teichoic acid export membrane protein n=1 Tax=Albibacterium bauzanense TaxID=653929 RepID=A0A4R1LZX0_9SPHI|nr:oligosaccharide flippase family protein [Albibacterium bauzanense]TCK84895.1 O-antigen/teichoic acid export membrane protein [Albibacterium bauzanense]